MDALAGLLEGPRARGAFMIRACFDPPWCIRVEDRAPLTIMLVVRGEAWVMPDGQERTLLRAGDLAIARGPDPYTCADSPATEPQAVILPGGECAYPDGRSLKGHRDLGVRSWGDRPDGSTVLLIGTYLMQGEITGRLLDALPPLLSLTSREWKCPLTPILAEEIVRDEPGQEVVLDRLLDLLVIAALRAWFSRRRPRHPLVPGAGRPGRGPGAAAGAGRPRPPLDGGLARRQGRGLARRARPPLHRARR
nr:cupin domain-containing protein [Streptomyces avermitilis]